MPLDTIILTCTLQIKGERSTSNIYRLLTGERSIQTIQDAYLYQLDSLYGISTKLKKKDYEVALQLLVDKGHLIKVEKENQFIVLQITKLGESWLLTNEYRQILSYFNGKELEKTGKVFYDRLLLLIQTLTNTKMGFKSYIPIVDDTSIHQWVKTVYRKVHGKEITILESLEKELLILLTDLPEEMASIFVDRLTGYEHYGKSIEQLAIDYNMKSINIDLLVTATIHYIVRAIKQNETQFKVLSKIILHTEPSLQLQYSTKQTYQLFIQGHPPESIAKIRYLKLNTIYDHLAEIALFNEDFPFEQFITSSEKQTILQAMEEVQSYKLKEIKQKLAEDISYFQIRLMLAWYQHENNLNASTGSKVTEEGE